MQRYRLVLVLLCLGLLGAMPFVIGASKPGTAGDQRESTVQGQTPVQRQIAYYGSHREPDPIVGGQIEGILFQAQVLAESGKYKEAMAAVDEAKGIANKDASNVTAIEYMRQFVSNMQNGRKYVRLFKPT